MTKPDDKRVPAYKLPMEYLVCMPEDRDWPAPVGVADKMQRAVEVLAEYRYLDNPDLYYYEDAKRRNELKAEADRLLTELEVEVKRV